MSKSTRSNAPPPKQTPPPQFARRYRNELIVFFAVFGLAMAFALYTNHAWEDYYITYRVSKNLATGHGLVFTPGERVHTFTSPLNVLLPAMLSLATGNTSDLLVLWLFRGMSAAALALAAVLLFRVARELRLSPFVTVLLLGLFGTDAKIVDFSINGQEVGFMMLFLALMLYGLMVPTRSPVLVLGLAWAGLLWTRPDGFIYFGATGLGVFLFGAGPPGLAGSRRALLKLFLGAGLVAALLYLPWFLWAWHYFGTPVPHTVIAKGLRTASPARWTILLDFLIFPFKTLAAPETSMDLNFLPVYVQFGGWPEPLVGHSRWLAWLGAFYWCFPLANRPTRAISFAFMTCHFYLIHIAPGAFPWYLPNCALLGFVVVAQIVQQWLELAAASHGTLLDARSSRRASFAIKACASVLLAWGLVLLLGSAYEMRVQQQFVEEGGRKQIGLWLRAHAASPLDTVFLEPLGYIGYFSQLKMYDVPGLSSPEVVAARKRLATDDFDKLIAELKPDWLVLRPHEANKIADRDQALLTVTYSAVHYFNCGQSLSAYRWLPGRGYVTSDQAFFILRRNSTPPAR
jgi:hypothetical protein